MMDKDKFTQLLIGRNLRTIGQNSIVVRSVKDQQTFDELFGLIFHHERPIVMRAADAVEKITIKHPEWIQSHKAQILRVLKSADHKELKWHIAQLVPRIELSKNETEDVFNRLTYWALNKNESKIVRVNALQGLHDLSQRHPEFCESFNKIVAVMKPEMIPSIQARIRKLERLQS